MAGNNLFQRLGFLNKSIPDYLRGIVEIGVTYGDVGQQLGVGREKTEKELTGLSSIYGYLDEQDRIVDANTVPYFKQDYATKLEKIRRIADHPEIEFITHKITNSAVTADSKGFFCRVTLDSDTDAKYNDALVKEVDHEFRRIYGLWGFNKNNSAWSEFLKFLEEGYLSYEMVYDDVVNPTTVTGFNELEPLSLVPIMADFVVENDGGEKTTIRHKIWKQMVEYNQRNSRVGERSNIRNIPDESMIFISYSRTPGNTRKFSYIEKLLRSFNMMRTMENCLVSWYVMNSQSRLKMIVPVSGRNTTKAKEALTKVKNKYREDITIDHESGEVMVNGKPHINFSKMLMLPSRNGQKPEIDGVSFNGPDLSRMEPVKYFRRKLQRDSGLPYSKFDRDSGGGPAIEFNGRGGKEMSDDEKDYYLNLSRLRNEFKQIILKPVHRQMILNHPELKDDPEFETSLSVKFHADHNFEDDLKTFDELDKIEKLDKFQRVKDENNEQVYSTKYLMIHKLKIMAEEEWEKNTKMKAEEKEAE